MSRRTSDNTSPINTASVDRLNQPRFSHTKKLSAVNGFTSHSAQHPEEKWPPRSIFKTFRKLAHRSKQSRGSSTDLTSVEISQPVLVSHRTAAEIISSVLGSNNYSDFDKPLPKKPDNSSSSASDSELADLSPTQIECLSPTRKVSKSLPASSAAKLIFSALPPPPPVPNLPAKNPSRVANKKDTPILRHHRSQSSIGKIATLEREYRGPSFQLRNQGAIEFDYTSADELAAEFPLKNCDIESPLTSQHSSPPASPSPPASQLPSLCQDASFSSHSKSVSCSQFPTIDAACQTEDTTDLHQIIAKLTAQNEFLLQELEKTKLLLANEIKERHRVAGAMQRSREKFDSISCQAYEKLQEMIDENRRLEDEAKQFRGPKH